MIDKEKIVKNIEKIEGSVNEILSNLEDYKIEIQNLTDIEDFLYDLSKMDNLPDGVQDKAHELWQMI